MGWGNILGKAALGVAKVGFELAVGGSLGGSGATSQQTQETPKSSSMFSGEREEFDKWIIANGSKPVGDCKEEFLEFLNRCISKAYKAGGQEMEDGIRRNNPRVRWE
jgi:hypothetical protein